MTERHCTWTALAILAAIAVVALLTWHRSPDFRLGPTWEEDSMFYIVGKNLVDRGFWRTRLLDDYAVGTDPSAHPMLYTHFPTLPGLLQGGLQEAGARGIHAVRFFFLPVFLGGLWYLYLVTRRLFGSKIALLTLAVTGTNFFGVINWADSTYHAPHWLVLFGALYHFLHIPRQSDVGGRARLHVAMTWFFLFMSVAVTYIHVLFLVIAMGLFHATKVHRIRTKYLIVLCTAPPALFLLHQVRVLSLLGPEVWMQDQIANIRKAAGLVDYRMLLDFYERHGIVVWPSDYRTLTLQDILSRFFFGLRQKEGLVGIFVLADLLTFATLCTGSRTCRDMLGVDRFGAKVLSLFAASIAWNFAFPTHATNYFNATPYMMLAGMTNLAWGVLFAGLTSHSFSVKATAKGRGYRWAIAALMLVLFCGQRVGTLTAGPLRPVPGSEVLAKYQGATFYSNVWPLLVSYYTGEWSVGGICARDAVDRNFRAARWFLQRDKSNLRKYGDPEYYFYAFSMEAAPFAGPAFKDTLDRNFPVVECGPGWCIYRMGGY